MQSFKDIIKKSFMETFDAGAITPKIVIISLLITVVFALYLFFVYKIFQRKSLYNLNFNLSLVGMAIVTAAIVLAIQSNLVLSLGMVGALSIVRYRSAVKDPMDLFFLFWAIAVGIMCGARQYMLTLCICIILSIIIFALTSLPSVREPLVLVVNAKPQDLEGIENAVNEECTFNKVKTSFVSGDKLRMIIEIKTKDKNSLLLRLCKMEGVSASILTFEGDITA